MCDDLVRVVCRGFYVLLVQLVVVGCGGGQVVAVWSCAWAGGCVSGTLLLVVVKYTIIGQGPSAASCRMSLA
jgi:hypothetical protein